MTDTFFEYLGWVSLSDNLSESFEKAILHARESGHQLVETEHLVHALVDDPEGAIMLSELNVDRDGLRDQLAGHLENMPAPAAPRRNSPEPDKDLKRLMARASDLADEYGKDQIDGGDVLKALSKLQSLPAHQFLRAPRKSKRSTYKRRSGGDGRSRQAVTRNGSGRPGQRYSEKADPDLAGSHALAALDLDKVETVILAKTRDNRGSEIMEFSGQFGLGSAEISEIRSSFSAIMERRKLAEEVLDECEWYHIYKSLNRVSEEFRGEENAHRREVLRKAEIEINKRPRCRKAFLYVRHLDEELAKMRALRSLDFDDEQEGEFLTDSGSEQDSRQNRKLRALEEQIKALKEHTKKRERHLKTLEEKIAAEDKRSRDRDNELQDLIDKMKREGQRAAERESHFKALEERLQTEGKRFKSRDEQIAAIEKTIRERESQLKNLEQQIRKDQDRLRSREQHLTSLDESVRAERERSRAREENLKEFEKQIRAEEKKARDREQALLRLEQKLLKSGGAGDIEHLQALDSTVKAQNEEAKARERHVLKLEEHIKAMEERLSNSEELARKSHARSKNLEQEVVALSQRKDRVKIIERTVTKPDKEALDGLVEIIRNTD